MEPLQQPLAFFDFIDKYRNCSPSELRLRFHGKITEFDADLAITQIECRKKCARKLKSFLAEKHFVFPTSLSSEQASNEAVAAFHASLIKEGGKVADMTAGLGIDAMSIARKASSVTAFETDTPKAEALLHNSEVMGIKNLRVVNADSVEWIKRNPEILDAIFIDPARRDSDNARVYNLRDCTPDVISNYDSIISKCTSLLIKASPLLDITQTLKDIPGNTAIRAVSVCGECKEILVEASAEASDSVPRLFDAVNLNDDGGIISRFSYHSADNTKSPIFATLSDIREGRWLYEPNASVMKLAPWGVLTERYPGILKLAHSSHLFISDEPIRDFPGRTLRIIGKVGKKERRALKGSPANVVTRNYPISAVALKKKLATAEGDDLFVYGSRVGDTPVLILAKKFTF